MDRDMPAEHATEESRDRSDPPRRLRIVSLVTNLYIAGDSNRLLAYARAVDATRYDHRLLLLVRPDDRSLAQHGPMVDKFEAHGIRIDHLDEPSRASRRRDRGRLRTLFDDARAFPRILRQLRSYFVAQGVDVVDARLSYSILLGAIAGRWAGVPVIVATEYGQEFWRPPLRWLAGQIAYKLCDALISDSNYRVDSYKKWLWFGHKRAVTIENGIFTPRSQRSPKEMRREFGLPTDERIRIIGQVSRLVPYKGHRILIDAARRVLDADPDVAFLICGYAHVPNYIDELNAQAKDLGIADRVRIVSYPGPIADVWQAIDVHAHASVYDSSPIAIHESMALGRPAVVTSTGGIPDLVIVDKTGLVVPPGDPAAFADGLLRVLGDVELAQRLGRAARKRFENGFRARVMTDRLHQLFEEILDSKRRRPDPSPAQSR